MKAYVINKYREDARFELTTVETPKVQEGYVVIAVKATSLNPADFKLRTLDLGINPELPAILHMDVSGTVVEVGSGVEGIQVGDQVYGCAGGVKGLNGALADYMLADANLIAPKPNSQSFAEAAALPLVSITAWEGLHNKVKISSEDHVLIHGGTGGVGHLALQLAKQLGAKVAVTVSSDEKAELAKKLGANNIINYRNETVESYVGRLTSGTGFDVVFDTVGGEVLEKSFDAVRTEGNVISTVTLNTHNLSSMHMKSLSLHVVFMLLPMLTGQNRARHGNILREVAKLVDQGKIKPLIHEQRFGFDQANEAHSLYASSKHIGKIVLMNEPS